jgi:hypothetical protein
MAILVMTHIFQPLVIMVLDLAGYWLLSSQREHPEYCFRTFLTVYGNQAADTYLATPGNNGAGGEQGIGC